MFHKVCSLLDAANYELEDGGGRGGSCTFTSVFLRVTLAKPNWKMGRLSKPPTAESGLYNPIKKGILWMFKFVSAPCFPHDVGKLPGKPGRLALSFCLGGSLPVRGTVTQAAVCAPKDWLVCDEPLGPPVVPFYQLFGGRVPLLK